MLSCEMELLLSQYKAERGDDDDDGCIRLRVLLFAEVSARNITTISDRSRPKPLHELDISVFWGSR